MGVVVFKRDISCYGKVYLFVLNFYVRGKIFNCFMLYNLELRINNWVLERFFCLVLWWDRGIMFYIYIVIRLFYCY